MNTSGLLKSIEISRTSNISLGFVGRWKFLLKLNSCRYLCHLYLACFDEYRCPPNLDMIDLEIFVDAYPHTPVPSNFLPLFYNQMVLSVLSFFFSNKLDGIGP